MQYAVSHLALGLFACLSLCGAGCGGTASEGPSGETAAAEDDGSGLNPAPVSLKEALQVIDLRTFPVMEGAIYVQKTPVGSHFSIANGEVAKTVEFYRTELAKLGWTPATDPKLWQLFPQGAQLIFRKAGHRLYASIGITPADKNLNAGLFYIANIDARKLPRQADAEIVDVTPARTIYKTAMKPDDVKTAVRAELSKQGWREYRRPPIPGVPAAATGADDELKFLQGPMVLEYYIVPIDGKTQVMGSVRMLKEQLPLDPSAKSIEFEDQPELWLLYYSSDEPAKLLDFHRKALAELGWKIRAGTDKLADDSATVALDMEGQEPLRLEIVRLKDSTVTLVRMTRLPKDEKEAK